MPPAQDPPVSTTRPDAAWERLPRVGQLDPQIAVGGEATRGRGGERDRLAGGPPVGSVIQDPPLVELAKRHPTTLEGVASIRGIHQSIVKRRGAAIIEAIALGLSDPPIPREERPGRSDPGDAPLIALAEALLRARASDTGLAYELIASRSDLERIISAAPRGKPEPGVRTLAGWRRELVGGDIEGPAFGAHRRGGRSGRRASSNCVRAPRARGGSG